MKQRVSANSDAAADSRMQHPTSLDELGRRLSAVLELFPSRQKACEVAERAIDQLGKYMRGVPEPPFLPLARLCAVSGTRMEWLATGAGPLDGDPAATSQ